MVGEEYSVQRLDEYQKTLHLSRNLHTESLTRPLPVRNPLIVHSSTDTASNQRRRPIALPPSLHLLLLRIAAVGIVVPRRSSEGVLIRLHERQRRRQISRSRPGGNLGLQFRDGQGVFLDEGRRHHAAGSLAWVSGRGEVVCVILEVRTFESHPAEQGCLLWRSADTVFDEAVHDCGDGRG